MSTLVKKNGVWVKVSGHIVWMGTKEQLAIALANGEIADGTEIMINNDYNSSATDNALGDWVDVSSTAVSTFPEYAENFYTLDDSEHIVRYRKLGPHLMFLDCRYTIKYIQEVTAGVMRQEDHMTFNIPALLVHGDTWVPITGYTRVAEGVINPLLEVITPADGDTTATIRVIVKTWHSTNKIVGSTERFNIQGTVMVDRWLD